MAISSLQTTAWLSKRLGLSLTTIERLRAQNAKELPPHITIGSSIKYDEATVEAWLQSRLQASATVQHAGASHE
jgi:predicted DNA-binding transcriptional regulator AlpA